MIGDEYFHLRAQLGTALFSLATLAHDLQAPDEAIAALDGANAALREPFMFVALGEAKAGKSSVLNSLFGKSFCPAEKPEAAEKVHVFKYGIEAQDVAVHDALVESHRPHDFLRDFTVIDTPGTNALMADRQQIAETLAAADVVLFVFSITNLWAASAWEFLTSRPEPWVRNTVFVLQQADLRSASEVEAVVKHLSHTAQEKLGFTPPVFPVSAKKALLAKTGAVDRDGLMRASGFDRLELYLGKAVARGDARTAKLRTVCQTALSTLRGLGEKARASFSSVEKDVERLNQIGRVLDERREQSLRQVGGLMWSLSQSYERSQKSMEELVLQQISWAQTAKLIVRKEEWPVDFQKGIDRHLQDALQRQIANSIELIQSDLRSVWQQLHETLAKNFPAEAESLEATPPDFARERGGLLKRIEESLAEKMSGTRTEVEMTKTFGVASIWLRVPAALAVGGGLATVGAAMAHLPVLEVTGGLAGVSALAAAVIAVTQRKQILREFRRQMARKREELLAPIEDHLRHSISLFYQELAASFQPMLSYFASQQRVCEPMMMRTRQLEETFTKASVDLGLARK